MFAKPQAEHQWLDQFVGDWTVESECIMGPDQPPMKTIGKVHGHSLGGLWCLLEMEGEGPEGGKWTSIMTLGYDPAKGKFVGSFIGSMMANLWVYEGTLDAAKRKLTLDTTGPKFDQNGTTQYQDMVEVVSADHWILSSQMLGDDGSWMPFMTAHHRRIS